jgi:hypothetical protein
LHAWLASKDKNVVLFASTEAAAARLGGGAMTGHRRFSIPARSSYLAPLYPGSFAHDVLLDAHAFLGNEFSIMDRFLLDLIVFQLQQVTKTRNLLEHKLLILFGDHAQLPAVCRHDTAGDRVCEKCHISRSVHWMSGVCLGLTILMGHDDSDFLSFLCIIRHRRPTQEEIDACLDPCFVGQSAAMADLDADTTVLCSHWEQVVDYNACVFPEPGQLQNVSIVTNGADNSDWLFDHYFHQLQTVAFGAKVILTQNLDPDAGAAKRVSGKVVRVKVAQKMDDEIVVRLSDSDKEVSIRRSSFKNLYHDGKRFFEYTFPLIFGYAMTGHRSREPPCTTRSSSTCAKCSARA